MDARPTTLLDGLVFPEGPRWHDDRLWVSDIHGHQVLTVDLDGNADVVAVVDKPSGLGFLPDGTPLVVGMHSMTVWKIVDGGTTVHADLSGYGGQFLNDMVVDGDGRAYVGLRSWGERGAPSTQDRLILVHPDGSHQVVADGLTGPNGVVVTADGAGMILAETLGLRLTAFDRSTDGTLGNRRTFATLGRYIFDDGRKPFPDGICLDADGAVWVGTAKSGDYLRVAEGGTILDRFAPNAAWATACMLGGPDRRHLFLVTADSSIAGLQSLYDADIPDHDQYLAWARTQSKGYVEVVEVAVPGAGLP